MLTLEVPSEQDAIHEAHEAFVAYLARKPMAEEDAVVFAHAVREALDNACHHGNAGDAGKRVRFRCTSNDEGIHVEVADEGPGFDYEAALRHAAAFDAVAAARAQAAAGRRGGLGLGILVRACDEVTYDPPGNRLRLRKRYAGTASTR